MVNILLGISVVLNIVLILIIIGMNNTNKRNEQQLKWYSMLGH